MVEVFSSFSDPVLFVKNGIIVGELDVGVPGTPRFWVDHLFGL
jgi:hypothetical protein